MNARQFADELLAHFAKPLYWREHAPHLIAHDAECRRYSAGFDRRCDCDGALDPDVLVILRERANNLAAGIAHRVTAPTVPPEAPEEG